MKDIVEPTPVDRTTHPVTLARQRIDLSREGLAFKAGVSFKTIERIETGRVIPHRLTQRAIAGVLNCDPADLWPEEETAA